jgi:hypothetical protein
MPGATCAIFSNNAAKRRSKSAMRKFFLVLPLALCICFVACQRQQTEEERRAEIDREVQQRLAAERQQQQEQRLNQREAELTAREQSLTEKERQTTTHATSGERLTRETSTTVADGQPTGSYSMFYTKLEPYGDWIETRDYGYVYRPREAASGRWRPYLNGHWVYTDAGWTWISDEPFGWATYHYGRWTRIRGVGWVWVPADEWAPAWVSWRKGADYVGWAPLPPEARFDRRSGIHNWSDSYYDIGPDQYVFVLTRQFGDERVERAIVPEQRNVTIISQTANVTNITYNNTMIVNQGPSYEELQAQTQTPIRRLRLERQTTVTVNEPRAALRGDVLEIPAPIIAPVRPSERPRTIKQTIAQATVDLGWAAITNQHDAEQARAKIKAEATPPRDAPPKKFVGATETSSLGIATATPTPTSTPRAAETSTPIPQRAFTPRAIATPIATPSSARTSPSKSTESSRPTPTAPPVISPSNRGAVGEPEVSAPPVNTTTPGVPSPPRERGKLSGVARQLEKQTTAPMTSPSINARAAGNATPPTTTPGAIAAPSITPEVSVTPVPTSSVAAESPASGGSAPGAPPTRERRQNAPTFQPGVTPPGVSASAAGSVIPGEAGTGRQGKRDKRARARQNESFPSASPSPAGQQ